ncbi:MAG: hypothetical protein OEY85_12655 [Rhodospirillales bacterium]|nr:hypothetical protein [Rhodospirillales bacterium]
MKQRILFLAGTLLFGWSLLPSAAQAQAQALCGDRNELIEKLKGSFAEIPHSMGLASNGSMIEIFASPDGSWTIVMTQPDGVTCLMAAGENWEDLPQKKNVGTKI